MADEIPTAARFDRYGEIRYLGHVKDKGTGITWVVIRRKGGSKAVIVTEGQWFSFAATPAEATAPLAQRLSVFGAM